MSRWRSVRYEIPLVRSSNFWLKSKLLLIFEATIYTATQYLICNDRNFVGGQKVTVVTDFA